MDKGFFVKKIKFFISYEWVFEIFKLQKTIHFCLDIGNNSTWFVLIKTLNCKKKPLKIVFREMLGKLVEDEKFTGFDFWGVFFKFSYLHAEFFYFNLGTE